MVVASFIIEKHEVDDRTFCNSPKTVYVPSVGAAGGIKYRSSAGTSNACKSSGDHFFPRDFFVVAASCFIVSNFSIFSIVKCFQNGGGGGKGAVRARCVSAMSRFAKFLDSVSFTALSPKKWR